MKAIFFVTLSLLVGWVFAALMPVDGFDDLPSTRPGDLNLAQADTADSDAEDGPAADTAPDTRPATGEQPGSDAVAAEVAPRPLTGLDGQPRPIPIIPDADPDSAEETKPAIDLVSAEGTPVTDWPQWGGSPQRNNAPRSKHIPVDWKVAVDRRTGDWIPAESTNIKWVAQLGSQSYGNPVVADGRVYVGTNNAAGHVSRYPSKVDLGCLLCVAEDDGTVLWQYSSEKLASGNEHDWAMQGICCSPLVEEDRLWLVTNRGEVVCLDPQGFRDGENDGPIQDEPAPADNEADIVWRFDMMGELGVRQHNMASCSVTSLGELLFVCTSNGVGESHLDVPAPTAPSFLALNKGSGKVVWTDNSPGENILHGQWSSPAAGVLGGVPQVIFAGGDGWLYSFRADAGQDGRPTLLWKFDCNPKDTDWEDGGGGTRNSLIATPVIHDERVYVAVGQDPENQEGQGHLWCVDPTRTGDVSPHLVVLQDDPSQIVPHQRLKAFDPERGEKLIDNPNSAALWHYHQYDRNGDEKIEFAETMHRTLGTVAIADNLLFVVDFSGLMHCVDAQTGRPNWTHDMLSCSWGSPLITDKHVYVGDENGEVTIFRLTSEPHEPVAKLNLLNSVYSTPIVANGVLYISARTRLIAIEQAAGYNE